MKTHKSGAIDLLTARKQDSQDEMIIGPLETVVEGCIFPNCNSRHTTENPGKNIIAQIVHKAYIIYSFLNQKKTLKKTLKSAKFSNFLDIFLIKCEENYEY